MRVIPAPPHDWAVYGAPLPMHPQDDHTSWFYFRFEAAGPSHMPIQALSVRSDMSRHPSWGPKWFGTPEGKAYRALSRDEQ